MQKIQISDHFKISTILMFALPSIGMQLVDNTYQVADGYFISNYVGSSAFAAENLIFPPLAVVAGIGPMFGTGAAALISKTMGEGDDEKAGRLLSLTIVALTFAGILISILFSIFLPLITKIVGVSEELAPMCMEYARILIVCMPFLILNGAFHALLITANRPELGFMVSVINAVINIILDFVLVGFLGYRLRGAALATGLAWICSAMIPLVFFFNKKNQLHFRGISWYGKELWKICYNGSSEMMNVISHAVVAILFNLQLLKFAGETGVDAYAVNAYVSGVFIAIYYGIGMSINPAVGYHFGQKDLNEVRNIRKNGILLMSYIGTVTMILCFLFARPIAGFFVGYSDELVKMSVEALRIISLGYMFCGINIFCSSFFTGMGDGGKSLALASIRSLGIPFLGVIILPVLFGRIGIWLVSPIAEIIVLVIAIMFFVQYSRKKIL